ncbi:DUF7350 domain-containing protein [Natronomonas salina]|uniref:DUF7350 domain-containing protein n=1 Tax=Natronomonas salina TaxID=1710540 RepID=UPI003CCCBCFA
MRPVPPRRGQGVVDGVERGEGHTRNRRPPGIKYRPNAVAGAIERRCAAVPSTASAAALSATVRRDGTAATHLEFDRTLDPELGYHYGTALETDLRAGDQLVVATETPPQVARHEGCERASLDMEAVSFTV